MANQALARGQRGRSREMVPTCKHIRIQMETELISTLRAEALSVKECFTKFAFSAVTFAVVAFAFSLTYIKQFHVLYIGSVLIILLFYIVLKIGIHKYQTANRNSGYELFLQYSSLILNKLPDDDKYILWQQWMTNIGWEEALRAWRIVQPSVFEHLYSSNFYSPIILKEKHKNNKLWFEPNSVIKQNKNISRVIYYPGRYLRMLFVVMNILGLVAIILPSFSYIELAKRDQGLDGYSILLIGLIILYLTMILDLHFRIILVEKGFLCIHSCAIMWFAVIVAHYRALNEMDANNPLTDYIPKLVVQTDDLIKHIFNIDDWIFNRTALG